MSIIDALDLDELRDKAARADETVAVLKNLIFAVENDKKVHPCGGMLESALREAKTFVQ